MTSDHSGHPENGFAGVLGYVDKSDGRRKVFRPCPGEAMVRLADGTTREGLDALVESGPLLEVGAGFNRALGFAAVRLDPAAGSDTEALTERSEVVDALPVMVDDQGAARYFVPGELTVRFTAETGDERARALVTRQGSTVLTAQRTPGYYTVTVPPGRDLFGAVRDFSALPEALFAEPSEAGFDDALYLPDDPDFARLWGLRNAGQPVRGVVGTSGADIRATDAWDVTRGVPEVVITVIDTGAALSHPDLAPNLLPRGSEDWDFADPDDIPEDAQGHGTHVAGTAAAVDNTQGVIGVAPGCRIMPLRVNLTAGVNQNRADAISYVGRQAQAHRDRRYVINCSWRTSGDHAGIRTAIRETVAANVVIVFAAGNDNADTGSSPQFPGVYPEVVAVAALDSRNRRASFSNFGPTVDVSAPGVDIWSTARGGGNVYLSGTSMAAPHVAGVAALVWSRNLQLTQEQVRAIVENTCDDVNRDNPSHSGKLGRGRVSAFRAVTSRLIGFSPERVSSEIGGFDVWDGRDQAFAFDYDHSGKADHLVFYRPGTGTLWILKHGASNNFAPVYAEGSPGKGISGYDLADDRDRAFAFDYDHSGKLDHLALYRPGTGTMWILKHGPSNSFTPVYSEGSPGRGIGGYDLADGRDQAFAFDYDHSGKLDHLALYRPGTGTMWILKHGPSNSFTPVYSEGSPGRGIGGYDLADGRDRAFAFDYDHSGKLDHLALYRPGTGTLWILKHGAGNSFAPVYAEGSPGRGIGGYDLADDRDRVVPYDYDRSGKLDHLLLYRPGTGTVWILRHESDGTFGQQYAEGAPGLGIGHYDLADHRDRILPLDYDHNGKADHLVLYRPGARVVWIVRHSADI
ncbi:S8 family peptidase [Streptomyces chartreusis]|uniref:S8 family peptidase n=1 Tax=Streptomyces chartreusis TaxID=1969 RepID=UPI002E805039|nr:S8 family serine peptidase [Streptomyces chartreusis]WUB23218.1 S8 family serine peptidase [Streptomyces chartreusis]